MFEKLPLPPNEYEKEFDPGTDVNSKSAKFPSQSTPPEKSVKLQFLVSIVTSSQKKPSLLQKAVFITQLVDKLGSQKFPLHPQKSSPHLYFTVVFAHKLSRESKW